MGYKKENRKIFTELGDRIRTGRAGEVLKGCFLPSFRRPPGPAASTSRAQRLSEARERLQGVRVREPSTGLERACSA